MKEFALKKIKFYAYIYFAAVFMGIIAAYFYDSKQASLPINKKHIVIDAGHGGWDPGKVADGVEEKTINLEISNILKGYLEQSGAVVSVTRIEDQALDNSKRQDLKNRLKLANSQSVDLFISIHQNSFPSESVKGAQVFYYKDSDCGKLLAEHIQKRLKEVADNDNTRVPKSNTQYYLLKNSKVPCVIIECGFLSNNQENDNLQNENYQKRIAWAVYMGVLDYFGEEQV